MNNTLLVILPLLSAIVAWLTARLLLFMTMYPVIPVKVAGITFQGYVFKQKKIIASRVAAEVVNELKVASGGNLVAIGGNSMDELNPLIEEHIDTFLTIKLTEKLPVIASFVGESTMKKLKVGMMEEIELLLPDVISKYTTSLTTNPSLQGKLTELIANYPESKVENMFAPAFRKSLTKIPLLFAFMGGMIGCIAAIALYFLQQ